MTYSFPMCLDTFLEANNTNSENPRFVQIDFFGGPGLFSLVFAVKLPGSIYVYIYTVFIYIYTIYLPWKSKDYVLNVFPQRRSVSVSVHFHQQF